MLTKVLVLFGSISMIAFGVWHFFVPSLYKWYSYMSASAPELAVAVRATNVFFSLSLVLIGIVNIIFVFAGNRFTLIVMLAMSCVLWATRVVMQLVFPQGTINPALRYGMLAAFIVIFICFAVSLLLTSLSSK